MYSSIRFLNPNLYEFECVCFIVDAHLRCRAGMAVGRAIGPPAPWAEKRPPRDAEGILHTHGLGLWSSVIGLSSFVFRLRSLGGNLLKYFIETS